MNLVSHKVTLAALVLAVIYPITYFGTKFAQPWCLNSNDGPGAFYRRVFYPFRYADASRPCWYWRCILRGHWLTAKIIWNNPGDGKVRFELPEGESGAESGWDLNGAREGEVVEMKCSFRLETWDDFTDHFIPGVDDVKRKPNQLPDPTSPSVTPPAGARGAPSVGADH